MNWLQRALLQAGFFPRLGAELGAGLATVGASSFLGIHCVKYNLSPKVWPNLQVSRADI